MVCNDYFKWADKKMKRPFDHLQNVSYILSGRGFFLIFPASPVL